MRILLIQAYLGRREPPVAPLGLAALAAHLSHHQIKIFDPNIAAHPMRETTGIIEEFKPEIIGLSLRNIDTTKYSDPFFYFEHFQKYVKSIRGISPNSVMVVGGSGFSLFPHQIMNRTPEISTGFLLQAEESFTRFLSDGTDKKALPGLFLRNAQKIEFTGPPEKPNTDELPSPAWELVDISAYIPFVDRASIGVESKRGCALKCTYCTYPQLSGSELRLKSPSKVVEELALLKGKFGVNRIFFCDPVFNYPLEHAQSICREILNRELDIKWGAYQQDAFITPEYIALARESGCDDFYFSPDAASANGLKILRKASTVNSLNRSLEIIASDPKARASYNFFAAVPGTGWKNFLAAIWFLLKARLKLGRRLTRYKLSYIRLEPRTPLTQKVLGQAAEDDEKFLMPEDQKNLSRLFYRKSSSSLLNTLLSVHFHWGKWLGRKNVIEN